MPNKVAYIIFSLTFLINFIGIVALSTRIVGTRTKKIALSSSIFNIVLFISQFANTIQAPLLAKYIETDVIQGNAPREMFFRLILLAATIGATVGALFVPTIHRVFEKGVNALYKHHSIFRVIVKAFNYKTIVQIKKDITFPQQQNFSRLNNFNGIKLHLIVLNIVVYSFITTSVLSCLYAGYLNPALRTTALSMNGVISGIGAFGLLLFIEPYNSILTDKVIDGTVTEGYFRRYLSFVILARVIGVLLSQILLIPLAQLIAKLAEMI